MKLSRRDRRADRTAARNARKAKRDRRYYREGLAADAVQRLGPASALAAQATLPWHKPPEDDDDAWLYAEDD